MRHPHGGMQPPMPYGNRGGGKGRGGAKGMGAPTPGGQGVPHMGGRWGGGTGVGGRGRFERAKNDYALYRTRDIILMDDYYYVLSGDMRKRTGPTASPPVAPSPPRPSPLLPDDGFGGKGNDYWTGWNVAAALLQYADAHSGEEIGTRCAKAVLDYITLVHTRMLKTPTATWTQNRWQDWAYIIHWQ